MITPKPRVATSQKSLVEDGHMSKMQHEKGNSPQIDAMLDDALMSSQKLSQLMGVGRLTLSRWRSAGKGPPWIRLSSSRAAYPVAAYRAWISSKTIG